MPGPPDLVHRLVERVERVQDRVRRGGLGEQLVQPLTVRGVRALDGGVAGFGQAEPDHAPVPGLGFAPARYLCKRLRAECPEVKIVVGCWGLTDNVERIQERLRSAGADFVGLTMEESRAQARSLLEIVLENQKAKPRAVATK